MTLGIGVLGATSTIYEAAIRPAIAAVDGVSVVHEASRSASWAVQGSAASAAATAATEGVVRRSTAYEDVLADPAVEAVYIPLPNHLHEEWVLACAAAGKHVLCEKPLAIDGASARRMVAACEAAGVVLLEAYMSPFHPRSAAVAAAVADGVLGTVLHGEARMSGTLAADNHRWAVANGGGALLDVGIYCLEPVLQAFGWEGEAPLSVAASSVVGGDGVDETTSAWLAFDGGRTLHLWVSIAAVDQQRLALTGSVGSIEVGSRHATPDRRDAGFDLRGVDGSVVRIDSATGDCYEGLIAHFRDVVAGRVAPLRDGHRSVALADLLDRIAAAAGHARPEDHATPTAPTGPR